VERALYAACEAAEARLSPDDNVGAFLEVFAPMVPAVSAFFAPADEGGVMVMHEDPAVRENRLALLQRIGGMAAGRADLSKLVGF
jgi:glycyl-tRNA synthetase beta subunit